MKKINTRQLIIFYCLYSFSIKFLMLPSLLAKTAGPDCWISALIGTAIELCILFLAITVLAMRPNNNIYSILYGKSAHPPAPHSKTTAQSTGRQSDEQSPYRTPQPSANIVRSVFAKIVIAAMLCIFLLQLFILLDQSFHLLNENLFEHINLQYFSIPMLLLGVFFCFMPERSIFRSTELFFIFIIIGIALSVFPAITKINANEVLPIMDNGTMPLINGFFNNLIYFESSFMLLIFCGDIKVDKHFRKKFMTVATLLGAFFVFFVFMFYSLFGPLAPLKEIAVTNFTLYSSYITGGGRFDWVLITIWLLLLLIRFGITFFCAFSCLRYITNLKRHAGILGTGIAIFLYCISTFVLITSRELNKFISNVSWVVFALYIAVPILILLFSLFCKKAPDKNKSPASKHTTHQNTKKSAVKNV